MRCPYRTKTATPLRVRMGLSDAEVHNAGSLETAIGDGKKTRHFEDRKAKHRNMLCC